MTDIVQSIYMQKTLDELKAERAKRKVELEEIYRRFTKDFEIPTNPIKEPIDPESDYGKLVIGSRLKLPKGSKLPPTFKILMAQAQYERVELNELIALKQTTVYASNSIVGTEVDDAIFSTVFEPFMKSSVPTDPVLETVPVSKETSYQIDGEKRRRRRPRGGVKHRNNKENRKKRMMEAAEDDAAIAM